MKLSTIFSFLLVTNIVFSKESAISSPFPLLGNKEDRSELLRSMIYHEGPIPIPYHYLAPDGSEIRLLTEVPNGGFAHCLLPPRAITEAMQHQTVEEIWHFLEGEGLLWRNQHGKDNLTPLSKGTTVVISPGVPFQFRNTGDEPLVFLIVTMPPWPGPSEALKASHYWKLDVSLN